MPSRVLTGINLGSIDNLRLRAEVGPFFALFYLPVHTPTPGKVQQQRSGTLEEREKMFFAPPGRVQ